MTDGGTGGSLPESTLHLGLDFGGTNVKWSLVERTSIVEHAAAREAGGKAAGAASGAAGTGGTWRRLLGGQERTAVTGGAAGIVAQLAEIAIHASAGSRVRSVGIGVPGLYDPSAGTIRFLPNVPGDWERRPVAGPVGAALGVPAFLVNDARAFGVAELRLGAARGARSMVGLTLGTGVGGAVAVDGQVLQGNDGTAGELGHQTIDPDGPICGCGNRGCLEAYARADQIALRCGTASVEDAVQAGNAGDRRAVDGLAETGRYLGIGIANAVVALTPDVVVLGGGVAGAGNLIIEPLWAELRRRVHITSLDQLRIVTAELGVWAGSIGAAVFAAERAGVPDVAATTGAG